MPVLVDLVNIAIQHLLWHTPNWNDGLNMGEQGKTSQAYAP